MKKVTFVLGVLFSSAVFSYAQIPNGGFEIWESYTDDGGGSCSPPYNVYQKPDLWNGSLPNSCSTNSFSLQKNNESYPAGTGQYSLRIQPDLTNGVQGVAISNDGSDPMTNWIPQPAFAISSRPTSLFLYYKCLPFGGDTIIGMVYFYKNGVVIGNSPFGTNQTISTWTALEVPMVYTTADVPDSATILFTTGAYVRHSESVMYVDNLSFDGFITSISESNLTNSFINIYPNPTSNFFTLNVEGVEKTNAIINVYDVFGKLIRSEKWLENQQKINVENFSPGIYLVEVKSNEWTEKQKLILQ